MLPKKQKHLVLLPDGELPIDAPVEATSGHEISDEELQEVLPKLYLVNPNNVNLLTPEQNQVSFVRYNLGSFETSGKARIAVTLGFVFFVAVMMMCTLPDIPDMTRIYLWIFAILVIILVAITIPLWHRTALGRALDSLDPGPIWLPYGRTPEKSRQTCRWMLGQVTKAKPHDTGAGGSFEWEFVGPDGELGGGHHEVPRGWVVPGVGRPVLVEYKKPGLYRLL